MSGHSRAFNENKENKEFLEILKTATPSQKETAAESLWDLSPSNLVANKEYLQKIITVKDDEAIIDPLLVQLGLEEYSDLVYQRESKKEWFSRTLSFFGEIVYQKLNEGNTLSEDTSIKELLEDYYQKNGLGPVPKSFMARLKGEDRKNFKKGEVLNLSESGRIYYSLLLNLTFKLQRLIDTGNNESILEFLEKIMEIHKFYRLNPAFFPNDPKNEVFQDEVLFLGSIYLSAVKRLVIKKGDFKKAEEILKIYQDEVNLFIDEKIYNALVLTTLTYLSDNVGTLVYLSKHSKEKVNTPKALGLFLDFALELHPSKCDEETETSYCFFIAALCKEIIPYLVEMNDKLGNKYNPLTYQSNQFGRKEVLIGKRLKVSVKEMDKVARQLKTGLWKCIDLLEETIQKKSIDRGEIARTLIMCVQSLTVYYALLEENEEAYLELWENLASILQSALNDSRSPSVLLKAASFYTNLMTANYYLDRGPIIDNQSRKRNASKSDLAKVKGLLKNCFNALKNMKEIAVRKKSSMAFGLILWFYQIMRQYSVDVGNTSAARKAVEKIDKLVVQARKYGIFKLEVPLSFVGDLVD